MRIIPRRPLPRIATWTLIAVPILVAATMYATSLAGVWQARQWDDWWSRPKDARKFLGYQVRGILGSLNARALESRLDPDQRRASALRLFLDRDAFQRWTKDPQAAFSVWTDALRREGSRDHAVRLRPRGDTSVHWSTEKPSFTMRCERDDLFLGARDWAFSSKEVLSQHVVASLASEFGLLAPRSALVAVYINDRFLGTYRAIEVPDESFLRSQRRLPGTILRGDTAERGEVFKGMPPLFFNPHAWDQAAKGRDDLASTRQGVTRLLKDLHRPGPEGGLALLSHFERDELVRFFGFLLLTGDPFHITDVHNQLFYEDPSSRRLHPIPWDLYLRSLDAPRGTWNRLHAALFKDPLLFAEALDLVLRKEESIKGRLESLLAGALERVGTALEYDRLRKGSISEVGEPQEIRSILLENLERIRKWRGEARAESLFVVGSNGGPARLEVKVDGRGSLEWRGLYLPDGAPQREWTVHRDCDQDGLLDPEDAALPGSFSEADSGVGARFDFAKPEVLAAGLAPWLGPFEVSPVVYTILISGKDALELAKVAPVLSLAGSKVAPTPRALGDGGPVNSAGMLHPWASAPKPGRTVVLRGDVDLKETLRIGPSDVLVIEPGTKLSLHPDVSIFSRGRVVAEGRAEAPILFEASDGKMPFGALALLGSGANGSKFVHCTFLRGGGATLDHVEFKGMVSVHWVRDVVFDHCRFLENQRSDDAVNCVHADSVFRACVFERANSDALDLDYSDAIVLDSRFSDSGNDAIDCMTCSPLIVGNQIEGSGDKGVSIGEGSFPLLLDNVIRQCTRGIEVKDGSTPWVFEARLIRCEVGLKASRKNWRYAEGGMPLLIGAQMSENREDESIDAASRLARSTESLPLQWARSLRESAFLKDLRTNETIGGLESRIALGSPFRTVARLGFSEDFEDLRDGWTGNGDGLLALEKHGSELLCRVRRGDARIRQALSWTVPDRSQHAGCVILLRAEGEGHADIHLETDRGVVSKPIPLSEKGTFQAIVFEIAGREIRNVLLEARAGREPLNLAIRSISLHVVSGE